MNFLLDLAVITAFLVLHDHFLKRYTMTVMSNQGETQSEVSEQVSISKEYLSFRELLLEVTFVISSSRDDQTKNLEASAE